MPSPCPGSPFEATVPTDARTELQSCSGLMRWRQPSHGTSQPVVGAGVRQFLRSLPTQTMTQFHGSLQPLHSDTSQLPCWVLSPMVCSPRMGTLCSWDPPVPGTFWRLCGNNLGQGVLVPPGHQGESLGYGGAQCLRGRERQESKHLGAEILAEGWIK